MAALRRVALFAGAASARMYAPVDREVCVQTGGEPFCVDFVRRDVGDRVESKASRRSSLLRIVKRASR